MLDCTDSPTREIALPLKAGVGETWLFPVAYPLSKTIKADFLAALTFAVAVVFFFWRIVGVGLVPYGFDLLAYFVPYKAYISELVRQGELPLWNPNIFLGAPLLANIQTAVLYPLDLIFYLMPVWDALRYSVVLHVFLAALFAYLFGRISLGLTAPAAWAIGACFGFGGFLDAHVGHLNQLHAAVWLPILMLCMERATTRGSAKAVSWGALACAAQLLAGHTQIVYYTIWEVGLFALYMVTFGGRLGWARFRPLAFFVAIFGLGALVSSVQLLPTLELSRESYRAGGIPYREAVAYSVPLKELINSILPFYFEKPYIELIGYTGIVSIALLPAALAARRLTSLPWFFVGVAAMALLLSLGDGTPLYGWLHRFAPGFDLFRAPGRWLFLFSFSMACLAGIGVDALLTYREGRYLRKWLAHYGVGLFVGLALFLGFRLYLGISDQEPALPHPRAVLTWTSFALAAVALSISLVAVPRSRSILALLLGLAILELYLAKEPLEYNRPVAPSLYAQAGSVVQKLDRSRSLSIVRGKFDPSGKEQFLRESAPFMEPGEVANQLEGLLLKESLVPNVGMGWNLSSIDGYDGGLLPTRGYASFKRYLIGDKEFRADHTIREAESFSPNSRVMGALGVKYLIANQGWAGDPGWEEVWSDGAVKLMRNFNAKLRAYVVHDARVVRDEETALEALARGDIDSTVYLDEDVLFQRPAQAGGDDSVELISDRPNEVVVDASLGSPGFLVLSDSYYPGWKVYVDGREERLLKADFMLRAVQLSDGHHQIRFSYEPFSYIVGMAASALGLVLVITIPLLRRKLPICH